MERLTGLNLYIANVCVATTWGYSILVDSLGEEQTKQYIKEYSQGGNFYDPAVVQAAGRACGSIVPQRWSWPIYAKRGDGQVVDGKWIWAEKNVVPFAEFYRP